MKIFRLTPLVFIFLLTVVSCTSDEEIVNKGDTNLANREFVSMGEMKVAPVAISRNNSERSFEVDFLNDTDKSMLSFYLTDCEENRLYACDVDKNGTKDFYVQFVNDDFSQFYYLDREQKVLQKCAFTRNSDGEFIIEVLESYIQQTRALWGGGSESWSNCFSRRMGSATGVAMAIAAGFIGPEGTAAVAAGGALSCLLYNPF